MKLFKIVFTLTLFSLFAFSFSYAQNQGPSSYLVAHYNFNYNLRDGSGNNYTAVDTFTNGAATANPVQYVPGFDGAANNYAISFPGDTGWYRVDCGRFAPETLGVKGQLTIAFWAKWYGPVSDHSYQDIIDKRDHWDDSNMVFSVGQHSRWNYHLGLWHSSGLFSPREASSSDSIDANWHFFAITFNDTAGGNHDVAFFQDGKWTDSVNYALCVGHNAEVILGASDGGEGNEYNGALDEVSFYSRALTTQEISDLYHGYVTDVKLISNNIPTHYTLSQNYPNPFNPTTKIQFAIAKAGNYSLEVYNLLGQKVATLVNGQLNPGIHLATFDATKIASGIYLYRLTGNNVNLVKKMILMK